MFEFVNILAFATIALGQGLSSDSLRKFEDVLSLSDSFDPIQAAYWTGLPHHRRTPFAVSPDGSTAFLAYLNAAKSAVIVQQVDPSSFAAIGDAVSVNGYEVGGLVAHNDGFALLTKTDATGSSNLPTDNTPVASLVRYTNGAASWSTELNGASSFGAGQMGRTATPDINGDLVYSESAGLYGAYYVVTAYDGDASGHYGDAISYVDDSGVRKDDTVGTNAWGCSHNTGIAFEEADEAPFASVCAEDHGSIWLNTDTRGMSGIKIAGENTTNGVSGEPMGGMSGSYSNLARLGTSDAYMFAWQSRGCVNLREDDWMGAGFTQCDPRWLNHNVAVAPLSSKNTLVGDEAVSEVGAAEGDKQVLWITKDEDTDHQNVRVAAFDESNVLVTYEIISNPTCEPVPLSCSGTFSGTGFQLVSASGAAQGSAFTDTDVTVSGDIAKMADGRLCWPYVKQSWDLSAPRDSGTATSRMSFACISLDGSTSASSLGQTSVNASETASTSEATAITTDIASTSNASTTEWSEEPTSQEGPASTTIEEAAPTSSAAPETEVAPSQVPETEAPETTPTSIETSAPSTTSDTSPPSESDASALSESESASSDGPVATDATTPSSSAPAAGSGCPSGGSSSYGGSNENYGSRDGGRFNHSGKHGYGGKRMARTRKAVA